MKRKNAILLGGVLCCLALLNSPVFAAAETGSPALNSSAAEVAPGRIVWFDITTSNLPQSKEFYGKLFDWKFNPVTGTDQAVEIALQGKPIGTLRVADGKIGSFNGVVYVNVPDIQASCQKAKELGATISEGFPFNLPDGKGAIAVALDPSGHPVGMFSKTLMPTAK